VLRYSGGFTGADDVMRAMRVARRPEALAWLLPFCRDEEET